MNLKAFGKLIINPRNFINEKIEIKSRDKLENLKKTDFLYPINEIFKEDVIIAGFPKSGNTWMQTLISGLVYGIDTEYLTDKLAQEIVTDLHGRTLYKRINKICYFKSHHLPQPNFRKVIYIVRDGRDALTSYYYFNKNLGLNVSLNEMIKNNSNVYPCSWSKHVKSWLNNPYKSEILYIKYEDLLTNPQKELIKICEFLNLTRSIEIIDRVINGSQIDKMRNRVSESGGMGHKSWQGNKGKVFFRKGKIGDYKNLFSNEEIIFFNSLAKEELQHFGYEF